MKTNILLVLLIMLLGSGCHRAAVDYTGWDYVHRIGPPAEIADWAKRQSDPRKVSDAQMALGSLIKQGSGEAVDAISEIQVQLVQGWPSLRGGASAVEDRIEVNYRILAVGASDGNAEAEALFIALRPTAENVRRMRAWEKAQELLH